MSPIREKFIKAIKNLPYDIDEMAITKDSLQILEDITHIYIAMYGEEDLKDSQDRIRTLMNSNENY